VIAIIQNYVQTIASGRRGMEKCTSGAFGEKG